MYELPEIVEVGPAHRLTMGGVNKPVDDMCECSRTEVVVVDDGDYASL